MISLNQSHIPFVFFCRLKYISLGNNQLTGTIPNCLSLLGEDSLVGVQLNNNYLTGSIPESFCSLTSLYSLVLNDNALTGNIPTCLGNLNGLLQLQLSGNQLTGTIPNNLRLCPHLNYLHL